MRKLTKRIAFTFLGVLLMLMVILTIAWFEARSSAQLDPAKIAFNTMCDLEREKGAITTFFELTGRWPTSTWELVSNSFGVNFTQPRPPFRDGWGNPTIYQPFNTTTGYGRVISYGRDGRPRGVGADADIEVRFP